MIPTTAKEILEQWDNGSRLSAISYEDRQEACGNVIEEWYSNIIRPNRPRNVADTFALALSVFGATPMTPTSTINEMHAKKTTLIARLAAVMRQMEVGLLPSDEVGIPPTPMQTLTATRVNAILLALDRLRDMAVGMAAMHQMSVSPFVQAHNLGADEKPAEDPTPPSRINRWVENDMLRRGFVRHVQGDSVTIMGPVFTKIGMDTGVKEEVCDGRDYVARFLSQDRTHVELFNLWESNVGKIDHSAFRLLKSTMRCQIRDLDCDQHLRSFENGVFHTARLTFTPYGPANWAPQQLSDYREATTDPARRAVYDDVMTEAEEYRAKTASGVMSVDDGGSLTEEWRQRSSWADTGSGVFSGLNAEFKSSLIYIAKHLPLDCLSCPWYDIDVPAWNKIWTMQGFTREEILIINGFWGRSFFDVSNSSGGDGMQMMVMLIGVPGVGKGLAIEILSKLFPNDRIATLTNRPESVFYGMDFKDSLLMVITEMNNKFKKHMDQAELMQFVSAERVKLKVKNGRPINIPRWPAQLIAATNEQSLEGVGWGRRVLPIEMDTTIPDKDNDLDLPRHLEEELPKLCVLWARCYHLMMEKVRKGGAGIRHVLPQRFLRAMNKFKNRLQGLRNYICESGRVERAADTEGADPDDYYTSWDDLKEHFNEYTRNGCGDSVNLIAEENYMPVFRALGLRLVFETREDPVKKVDRNTGWVVGIRSLV